MEEQEPEGRGEIQCTSASFESALTSAFNRTDEEMNAGLDANAVSAQDRANLVATLQPSQQQTDSQSGTPARGRSPNPPSIPTSQSALGAAEGGSGVMNLLATVPTLQKSASADNPGAFDTIRDGLAGLGLLNTLGRATTSARTSSVPVPVKSDQELREMT